jgi:hypothetical protein
LIRDEEGRPSDGERHGERHGERPRRRPDNRPPRPRRPGPRR